MTRITKATDLEATREKLTELLDEHAARKGHRFELEELCLNAHDGEEFLGGISAKLGTEWVYVDLLALSEAARGKGIGGQLIAELEEIARTKGKRGIFLDTYSFQAPDFYRKMGFTEVGHIDDYPQGEARYFFAKRL